MYRPQEFNGINPLGKLASALLSGIDIYSDAWDSIEWF
jgi:hypothetical protein